MQSNTPNKPLNTFTTIVIPKKFTADLMKFLPQVDHQAHIPAHFKRVKPYSGDSNMNEVLICNKSLISKEEEDIVVSKVLDFLNSKSVLQPSLLQKDLLVDSPASKAEFEEMFATWPMTYIAKKEPVLTEEESKLYTEIINKASKFIEGDVTQSLDYTVIIDSDSGAVLLKVKNEQREGYPLDHTIIQAINDYSMKYLLVEKERYLLTNLTLITHIEPCMMCSMALVHSRIKRLIYVDANMNHLGALNQDLNINKLGVNHRYEVFKFDTQTGLFNLIS